MEDPTVVVLGEEDAAELETAREYFERGGLADRAAFESGNAHETFAEYGGSFDIVFVDHRKERYVEAFETAREKLTPGGLIVADNLMMLTARLNRGVLGYTPGHEPGTAIAR